MSLLKYKLDQLVRPDEKVVFRTRMGWRQVLTIYAGHILFFIVAGSMLFYFFETDAFLIVFFLIYLLGSYGNEAFVTNQRVLYRTGWFQAKLVEMRLEDIRAIERISEYVTLRDHAGAEVDIRSVPDTVGLADAIIAETGVRAPKLNTNRAQQWENYGTFFAVACGIAGIVVLYLVSDLILDWDALTWSNPWTIPALMFFILLIFVFLLAGMAVGMILLVIAMRLFLTVQEVRTFFHSEEAPEQQPQWAMKAAQIPVALAWLVACLLYGQRI